MEKEDGNAAPGITRVTANLAKIIAALSTTYLPSRLN